MQKNAQHYQNMGNCLLCKNAFLECKQIHFLSVKRSYKTELRKEMTTSTSTGSNDELSTAYSQYVNNTSNGTLSTGSCFFLSALMIKGRGTLSCWC